MKTFDFQIKIIEMCSLLANWQQKSIGSNNGFALIRHQAIICTNGGQIAYMGAPKIKTMNFQSKYHNLLYKCTFECIV